jgi:hypothetical protein
MTTTTTSLTVLTNSFHGTEYRTRRTREELDRIIWTHRMDRTDAERAFVRRAWKALCGIEGCTCCNELGER